MGLDALSLTSKRNAPAVVKKLKRFFWARDVKLAETRWCACQSGPAGNGRWDSGENGPKRLLIVQVRGTCKGC